MMKMTRSNMNNLNNAQVHPINGCACVSNAVVYGLEESIRGAKFPMSTDVNSLNYELTNGIKSLAQSPIGSAHDNWLNGVIVQFDLTFSNKAWVELERYHFIDFISSQSTMHRITKFDLDKAYNKYVDKRIIDIMKEKVSEYNSYIESYEMSKAKANEMYLEILYSNPAGFMLTARMTTNYRQLKTIYSQRRNHRLPEWRQFCEWVETLPYSELICDFEK